MKNIIKSIFTCLLIGVSIPSFVEASAERFDEELCVDGSILADSSGMAMTKMSYWLHPDMLLPVMGLTVPNGTCGLYAQIPAIGVYYGEGYNFRNRKGIIRMHNNMLVHAPAPLIAAVKTQLGRGTDARDLHTVLADAGVTCDFYTVVTGLVEDSSRDAADNTYNMVYHGFLSQNHTTGFFQENVQMGIFNPQGIEVAARAPIAFGSLRAEDVNFHAGPCCSPNNACFKVSNGYNVSSFWSVAVSPDNHRVAITYHLLMNTAAMEEDIVDVLRCGNYDTMLRSLAFFADAQATNDQTVLSGFVATLRTMDR